MSNSNLKLLFKPYLVQDEVEKSADREVMNALYDKLTMEQELEADSAIGIGLRPDETDDDYVDLVSDKSKAAVSVRNHETLKQPCVTRWNSVLAMIDNVLCLWNEMAAALTRNGDRELVCLRMTKTSY